MEKFNRAVRRHHVERLKVHRKSYWGYARAYGADAPVGMAARQLGKVVQYPASCSCAMCGNPRHFGKGANSESSRTLQEQGWRQAKLHAE